MRLEVGVVLILVTIEVRGLHYVVQDGSHTVVQVFLAQSSALHGILYVVNVVFAAWLQQVVAGMDVGCPVGKSVKCREPHASWVRPANGVASAAPVGHHHSLVSPLITQDGGEQVASLAGHGAVDEVIRAHHRPGVRLLDGYLEVFQVYLPCRPLAHYGIVAQSGGLLLVEGEMLYRRAHALALYAVDISRRYVAREHGVFRVVFEVASAQWVALYAHTGGEEHVHAIAVHLVADGGAHAAHELGVP